MLKRKYKKIVFLVILCSFSFSQCVQNSKGIASSINTNEKIEEIIFSKDEIEILNLVINDIWYNIDNETILIDRNIDSSYSINILKPFLEVFKERYGISEELLQSLHSSNSKIFIINPETKFNLQNYRFIYITDSDRRGNLKHGEHFPSLSFSRIGFNNDRTEAILEADYFFPLAGSGYIIHLKKENDIWKIINLIPTWVS